MGLEVESALLSHPQILEAVVVPVKLYAHTFWSPSPIQMYHP